MNDEVTELSSLKSNFMNWKNIIDACIADGSELHCLIKMEEILENLPQVDKRVSKLTTEIKDTSISFEPNNPINHGNTCISWLDSSFKEIRTAKSSASNKSLFVCSGGKNDYIYKENNSIKHVSSNNTISYYTVVDGSPFTYSIDFEDNIYVAGHSSDEIHQLTLTCKLIRIIPISTFATRPGTYLWAMRFEENSNRFLLTSYDNGKVLICQID
ncbi:unnamed protein product [Mytilus edulis]|uniref:Uncharacterized protein n=1 Tax=Mytilus edulis TaxID=6550 RepID=A0A8S3RG47_MYTED|nr:unnamed protein product [Mytilus edulis]